MVLQRVADLMAWANLGEDSGRDARATAGSGGRGQHACFAQDSDAVCLWLPVAMTLSAWECVHVLQCCSHVIRDMR